MCFCVHVISIVYIIVCVRVCFFPFSVFLETHMRGMKQICFMIKSVTIRRIIYIYLKPFIKVRIPRAPLYRSLSMQKDQQFLGQIEFFASMISDWCHCINVRHERDCEGNVQKSFSNVATIRKASSLMVATLLATWSRFVRRWVLLGVFLLFEVYFW